MCPNCRMTYGEFLKNSSFGCPTCYDVFGPLIPEKIKRIQGSAEHVGKRPMSYRDPSEEDSADKAAVDGETPKDKEGQANVQEEIEVLSRKLKEAIAIEDYEEAARLRDLIAGLRSGLTGKEKDDA